MAVDSKLIARFQELIEMGEQVKRTRFSRSGGGIVYFGDDGVNVQQSKLWGMNSLTLLGHIFGKDSDYYKQFHSLIPNLHDYSPVTQGVGILQAAQSDYERGTFSSIPAAEPLDVIRMLCKRFPVFARQLTRRTHKREPFHIADEYDVQYLFHALLRLHFEDVREEVWVPQYAGGTNRMDFWLKDSGIVLETKMTRESLRDGDVGDQLIIDIEKYSQFPGCQALVCYVYDSDFFLRNPRGLENDLSGTRGDLEVLVISSSGS